MIDAGCLEGINEVYGLHNLTLFKVGEVGCVKGPIMANGNCFNIQIKGKGGHGSRPDLCINPITIGSELIEYMNKIKSQYVDSKEIFIFSVGSFNSGETFNVIPEYAKISGTYRTINDKLSEKIGKIITNLCDNYSLIYNCEIKLDIVSGGYTTFNADEPTELVQKVAEKYFKLRTDSLPVMASEDFSLYQLIVPGCFFMLGAQDEEHKEYLHTPQYEFNDKSLSIGVEMFIRIIEEKANIELLNN
jgi:amidohydrolase